MLELVNANLACGAELEPTLWTLSYEAVGVPCHGSFTDFMPFNGAEAAYAAPEMMRNAAVAATADRIFIIIGKSKWALKTLSNYRTQRT